MHKIDYEEFFKIKNRDEFENEYLVALRFYENKDGKFVFTEKYNEMNQNYKYLISMLPTTENLTIPYCFPYELSGLLLADYKKLVEYFLCFSKFSTKYQSISEGLKTCFSEIILYDCSKIRPFFSKYSDRLNLYSCAYCEASYTGAWYEIEKDIQNTLTNNKGFFDLDHFFPKAEYPLFALCLYNFVPCCQICNSKRIKGDNLFLEFYNIDINNTDKAKEKLLQLSPVSKGYNFNKNVKIRYFPKKINTDIWHYAPLSQSTSESYEVFFDTDFSDDRKLQKANETIIKSMKLNERYNSLAIKNKGLYFLDLKKRYPETHLRMIADLLSNANYYTSLEEIEKSIFHKDEKYNLLEKMKEDLLE